uniref:Uncharacterized protein n=1 Tax=Vespula pensylvanica TaxID=30213 RepID=A0A834PDL4_VESPE|nr:hypothetical protein H0235_000088 [Vespula pensylvanica]
MNADVGRTLLKDGNNCSGRVYSWTIFHRSQKWGKRKKEKRGTKKEAPFTCSCLEIEIEEDEEEEKGEVENDEDEEEGEKENDENEEEEEEEEDDEDDDEEEGEEEDRSEARTFRSLPGGCSHESGAAAITPFSYSRIL